jgi:hypothetical protein
MEFSGPGLVRSGCEVNVEEPASPFVNAIFIFDISIRLIEFDMPRAR